MEFKESRNRLQNYIESENFKGYDPYDTLNSPLPFHWIGKWGPVLAIQFQKRNPFNIRGLLGIKKDYNSKAIGLLLHAYSLEYQYIKKESTLNKMDFFFNWLLENRTKGYDEYCWGYNFDWASPVKFLEKFSPTIVVSGFIAKGLFEYYQVTQNPKALEVLKSIGDFTENKLAWTKTDKGYCVSYSTKTVDCCYNANMLGAELYARLYYLTKEKRYKDLACKMTDFTIAYQKESGLWNYSIDIKTGKERTQIDFHQGYVLDSIHYVIKYCGENEVYAKALKAGAAYYIKEQFKGNGRSIFRVPNEYPVEIHNQAQGIISLTRLSYLSNEYAPFATTIAKWTTENKKKKKGY
ncbi:MAG: glycoside hydrolase family 127 protein, partial [Vicingaceae bacterium]|nr:glycoside hydrolase family 127 protein [Vicingaceae bacterium]